MFRRLSDMLIVKKQSPETEKKMDLDNLKFLRMVSLWVTILEGIMLIEHGYFGNRASEWYQLRVWCYSGYFLLSTVCYVLTRTVLCKGNRHGLLMFVGLGYCTASVFFGMTISATDFMSGSQAFVFTTIVICIAGFAFMRPVLSIPFFVAVFAIFYGILIFVCGAERALPTNYLILLLMVVWTNVTRYQTKLSDVTARIEYEKLNQTLEKMSLQDELTMAKNRRSLSLDAQSFMDRTLFLVMVDIDDFKTMNDTYGHEYGDWLLKEFAQLLQQCFLPQNVYRYGGDEFIVAVCDGIGEELLKKAKRLQADMCNLTMNEMNLRFTFSGGYMIREPKSTDDFNGMISLIDKALYLSKRNGKNQIRRADPQMGDA